MKHLIVVSTLLIILTAPALAEDYTMTTYYPAPNGQYDQLYANNVGAGTTAPGSRLEVYDSTAVFTTPLIVRNEFGTPASLKTVGIGFRGGNGLWASIYGAQQNANDWNYGRLIFATRTSDALGPQEKMTILANGNVGLGVMAPAAHLEVSGNYTGIMNTKLMQDSDDTVGLGIYRDAASAGNTAAMLQLCNLDTAFDCSYLYQERTLGGISIQPRVGVNANPPFHVSPAGNVGVGTNAPASRFVVDDAAKATMYVANTAFGATTSGSTAGYGLFGTNLYVQNGTATLKTAGTHGGGYGYAGMLSYWGNLDFYAASGNTVADAVVAPTLRMRIKNNGYVGIGVDPTAYIFEVNGRMRIRDGAAAGSAGLWVNGTGQTERAFVGLLNDSNVGFWGNAGAGWGLYMEVATGAVTVTNSLQTINGDISAGNAGAPRNMWAGGFLNLSDERAKDDIKPVTGALKKVMALNGVYFRYKNQKDLRLGLVAQDVEKVIPEVVVTGPGGLKGVNYSNLVAILIEAIKEQQKKIDGFEKEMKQMRADLDALKRAR